MQQPSNDPLHGKTLEFIVTELVNYFGWEALGQHIPINCFNSNPSIKSSLTFYVKRLGHELKWRSYISE